MDMTGFFLQPRDRCVKGKKNVPCASHRRQANRRGSHGPRRSDRHPRKPRYRPGHRHQGGPPHHRCIHVSRSALKDFGGRGEDENQHWLAGPFCDRGKTAAQTTLAAGARGRSGYGGILCPRADSEGVLGITYGCSSTKLVQS